MLVEVETRKDVPVCVVRLTTTAWSDKRGMHIKRSIAFQRRQCKGLNILEEDAGLIGAEITLRGIVNLEDSKDGLYRVVICNVSQDPETGAIDDYDYRLEKL